MFIGPVTAWVAHVPDQSPGCHQGHCLGVLMVQQQKPKQTRARRTCTARVVSF